MKRILIILLLLPALALGQSEDLWQQYLEDWAEWNETETLPDELLETLESFRETPVNLNDTASCRLLELPIISEFQWECLKAYILQNGEMLTPNELQLINGFDSITLRLLRPLVVTEPAVPQQLPSLKTMLTRGHHHMIVGSRRRVEPSRGQTDSIYLGDPYRLYYRYYYQYGDHLHLQVSGEKDPGEEFFRGSQARGFDHYGGYLKLNDLGALRRLVVGQYNLQFGQGATLWSGYAPWSGYNASPRRYGIGITGAGAMTEQGYLQGAATTVRLCKGLELTAFFSFDSLDATPSSTDSMAVQSLYTSGYHRSQNELLKRHQLSESLFGGHLSYQRLGLALGLTAYHSHYSRPILPKETAYNHFYFSGQDNTVYGLDFTYRHQRLTLFGEVTGFPLSGIAGLQLDLSHDHRLSLSHRLYQAGYQNLHNNPMRTSGSAPDEQGTQLSLQSRLPLGLRLNASTDLVRHRLVRYGTYGPSFGTDSRLRLTREFLNNKLNITLQYRHRSRAANASLSLLEDSTLLSMHPYIVEQTLRQQVQLRCDYRPVNQWRFSFRMVLTQADCEFHFAQNGLLLLQDIDYSPTPHLNLSVRYAYFNTDGYDSRVSALERHFLYESYSPSLQGRGHRTYLFVSWSPSQSVTLSAKYALTLYTDGRETIGSGYDITQGHLRQDVYLQMRLKIYPQS